MTAGRRYRVFGGLVRFLWPSLLFEAAGIAYLAYLIGS